MWHKVWMSFKFSQIICPLNDFIFDFDRYNSRHRIWTYSLKNYFSSKDINIISYEFILFSRNLFLPIKNTQKKNLYWISSNKYFCYILLLQLFWYFLLYFLYKFYLFNLVINCHFFILVFWQSIDSFCCCQFS